MNKNVIILCNFQTSFDFSSLVILESIVNPLNLLILSSKIIQSFSTNNNTLT